VPFIVTQIAWRALEELRVAARVGNVENFGSAQERCDFRRPWLHPSSSTAMTGASTDQNTARFLALLAPVHERAQATARRLCRSNADGDDVYQEAVLRAMARLSDLRDDQAFPAWFHRIVLSVHRERGRRSFWRRLLPIDALAGGEPAGEDGGAWADQRAGVQRMQAALATLPAVQREAVVLCDIDGYELAEVSEMQAVSLSAVKSRLVRGRARLRRYYERMGMGPARAAPVAVPPVSIDEGARHDPTT
jgi:RNA polymerase sigma-70 factor (ECF subfamily)